MAKTFARLVPAPAGRFGDISRPYTPAEVARLRGTVPIAYTLAEKGANRRWESLKSEPYVNSLGAVTGNQAMQQARAGLPAIYLSGWQVAADANTAGAMYPDQSLYPANAGPELCRRINRTFQRADQIEHSEGGAKIDWFVPIVADADERDREFITGERTPEGFYRLKPGTGLAHCIKRGISFAKYADLIWWETSTPNLKEAKEFAEAVHKVYPDKMLAYNCSPSFNWEAYIDKATIAKFQREIGAMGYKFQFVTLAGFHSLNHGMFELARGYKSEGMAAYSRLQQAEFASEKHGYSATRHQREVGTGYFDLVSTTITGGTSSTTALHDSTEAAQFKARGSDIH